MSSFSALPSDIALEIFKWLPCPASLYYARVSQKWRELLYMRWKPRTADWYRKGYPLTYPFKLLTQNHAWFRMVESGQVLTSLYIASLMKPAQETLLKMLDRFPSLVVVVASSDNYSMWRDAKATPLKHVPWQACPALQVVLFASLEKSPALAKLPPKYGKAKVFAHITPSLQGALEAVPSTTVEVCQALFSVGVSPNAHIFSEHLLSIAINAGTETLALSLIQCGADPLTTWDAPFKRALAHHIRPGLIAACLAASQQDHLVAFMIQNPTIWQVLFEIHRPDLKEKDKYGRLVEALRLLRPRVHFGLSVRYPATMPLLHCAARAGLTAATLLALAKELELSVLQKDPKQNTLLHSLAMSGSRCRPQDFEELVRWGIDPNARNSDGNTAMHLVVDAGLLFLVEPLLVCGASLGIPNLEKKFPVTLIFNKTWDANTPEQRRTLGRYSPVAEIERLAQQMVARSVHDIRKWQLEIILASPMHPDAPLTKKGESLLYLLVQQRHLNQEMQVMLLRAGANPMLTPPGGKPLHLRTDVYPPRALLSRHAYSLADMHLILGSASATQLPTPCVFCGSVNPSTAHTKKHVRVLKTGLIPYRPHCSRPIRHQFFLSYGPVHDAALGGALGDLEAAEQELLVHTSKIGPEPSPEMIAMSGALWARVNAARAKLKVAAAACNKDVWPSVHVRKRREAAAADAKNTASATSPVPAAAAPGASVTAAPAAPAAPAASAVNPTAAPTPTAAPASAAVAAPAPSASVTSHAPATSATVPTAVLVQSVTSDAAASATQTVAPAVVAANAAGATLPPAPGAAIPLQP